ncbi:hypothetical protein [Frateuria defendens]|uniref:hypothetical protein n=1 Tax=Frateuria defendens TaxID=2219559 RepID=UPI001F422FB2|nr:hypothetical protein [Frateuria defendens]
MNKRNAAVLAGLFSFGMVGFAVAAGQAATGLGQAWPNAADVSASPRWHVYVFVREGIRYIQVNDLGGKVRGAFATANRQFLVLPVGADSALVRTPGDGAAAPAARGEVVYQDDSIQVTATPQPMGKVVLEASDIDTCDPIKCNTHLQSVPSAPSDRGKSD